MTKFLTTKCNHNIHNIRGGYGHSVDNMCFEPNLKI